MDTLGVLLREEREAKGASLDDASRATRIRVHLLEALEAGAFAALSGGEVQIRGFLRIYARYLGLFPEDILERYDQEVHGREPAPEPVSALEAQPEKPTERLTAEDIIKTRGLPLFGSAPSWIAERRAVVAVAALAVTVVVVLALSGVLSGTGAAEPDPTATPTAEQAASPTPTGASPTSTPSFPLDPEGLVTVALEATEHVWVRATTESAVLIEGMMMPGQVETWSSEQTIFVETGNGAGLLITVNDQPLGTLCGRAELCSRAWTPTGEIEAP